MTFFHSILAGAPVASTPKIDAKSASESGSAAILLFADFTQRLAQLYIVLIKSF